MHQSQQPSNSKEFLPDSSHPIGFINRSAAVQKILSIYVKRTYLKLEYHNIWHTNNVMDDTRAICDKLYLPAETIDLTGAEETMNDYDVHNALTAAAGHDTIRLGRSDDEERSALFTTDTMMDTASTLLSEEHRQTVFSAILATKVEMVNDPESGLTIVQGIDKNSTIVDKVVCDADLAALGKPFEEYFVATALMAKENAQDLHNLEDRQESIMNFFISNLSILVNHRFHTEAARQLFPHAEENRETLLQLIETKPDRIHALAA